MRYRLTVFPPFEILEFRQRWTIRLRCRNGVHWLVRVQADRPEDAPGGVLYSAGSDEQLIEQLVYFGAEVTHRLPQMCFERMIQLGKAERLPAPVQGPSQWPPQALYSGWGQPEVFA